MLRPTYAHRSSRMLNGAALAVYQRTATYRRARARVLARQGLAYAALASLALWAAILAPLAS